MHYVIIDHSNERVALSHLGRHAARLAHMYQATLVSTPNLDDALNIILEGIDHGYDCHDWHTGRFRDMILNGGKVED